MRWFAIGNIALRRIYFLEHDNIICILALLCVLNSIGEISGLVFDSYKGQNYLLMDYKGSLSQNTSYESGLENALMEHFEGKNTLKKKTTARAFKSHK